MNKPKQTGRYVLAEYPGHVIDETQEYEAYDDRGYCCLRCETPLDAASWSGLVLETENDPCIIEGKYKQGVLEHVYANREWLKSHFDELKLFPPLREYTKDE